MARNHRTETKTYHSNSGDTYSVQSRDRVHIVEYHIIIGKSRNLTVSTYFQIC